jgi:hypothetical protein
VVLAACFAADPAWAQTSVALAETKDDWNASWIWRDGDEADMWVAFRKTVVLDAPPAQALASIAVESKYWLWINGEPVVREGGLKRGPTPVDGYYDEVDIAPYLTSGENTIAILVWYWNRSGYSHAASGKAGLLFEASIDGQLVVSDESWKSLRMFAYGYSGVPVPNFRLPERNVIFNAANHTPNWHLPSYSTGGWPNATVIGEATGSPWNRLYRRPIPQWRWGELQQYSNQGSFPSIATGDTLVAVLPRHAHVTPYLRIRAAAGDTIDIRTDRYSVPSTDRVRVHNTVRTEYITVEGEQEFETPAWMNGEAVRYHFPAGVEILDLRYRESGYDTDFTGSFFVDDTALNTLWTKARATVYGTMRDYFMETAGRERKQATSDGTRALLSALHSMDSRVQLLARKFWSEFSDWRTSEGAFRSGVPGNWLPEQPQINLYAYGDYGFWQYFLLTGDRDALEVVYPHIRKYLLLWQMDASGLVVHREGDWDWFDWEHNIDEDPIENALYQIALRAAIKMAVETGNQSDIPEWERRMESIHAAYNEQFWQGNFYRSAGHNGPPDDRANALAYLAGLSEKRFEDDLNAVLRSEKHSSPYMDHFVLMALLEMGDIDGALTRMKDRYGPMVDHSSSTLREYWDPAIGSLEHPFATGTLALLTNHIGGISPLEPAFEVTRIEPNPGPLRRVEAEVPSPHGLISVDLEQLDEIEQGEAAQLVRVTIPEGITGRVGIPKPPGTLARIETGGKIVWSEDDPVDSVDGLRPIIGTDFVIRFEAASGVWLFEVFIKPPPAQFTDVETRTDGVEALLSWVTEEERDSTQFVVEEFVNGQFVPVGFTEGSGGGGATYEFPIPNPGSGLHRYRIKAIGVEGGVSYSPEVVLEVPMDQDLVLSEFYPNPVDRLATITVSVREAQDVSAAIYNTLGQRVKTVFDAFLEPGNRYRYQVDVSDLPSGAYGMVLQGRVTAVGRFAIAR